MPGSYSGWSYGRGYSVGIPISDGADFALAGIVQPDGKVVLAGSCSSAGIYDIQPPKRISCLIRYSPDGSLLDPQFQGVKGDVVPWIGKLARTKISIVASNSEKRITGIATRVYPAEPAPNIKLMTVASTDNLSFVSREIRSSGTIGAERVSSFTDELTNRDGGLDNVDRIPIMGQSAIDPNNAVIASSCLLLDTAGSRGICLARYSVDTAAKTNVPYANGSLGMRERVHDYPDIKPEVNSIRFDSSFDDGFAVVGRCFSYSANRYYGCVHRFRYNGDKDTPFSNVSGNPGLVTFASMTAAYDASIQGRGGAIRTIVLGRCQAFFTSSFCLSAVNGGGFADSNWNNSTGSVNLSNLPWEPSGVFSLQPRMVTQVDGKMVVGYGCKVGSGSYLCLARYNMDGTPDTTFVGPTGATTGAFFLPLPGATNSYFADLSLAPDGRILVTATCETEPLIYKFCAALLNGGGYTYDVTGAGLSSKDNALMMLRYMMGYRGSALIAGINIPSTAPRRFVENIEPYLALLSQRPANSNQCWMGVTNGAKPVATIDGLILMRYALGGDIARLTGGINFPNDSSLRTDLGSLLNYIFDSCGLSYGG
ncbi:MAG: hypothetical protein ACRCWJ_04155 [Casimicrobium sp.]